MGRGNKSFFSVGLAHMTKMAAMPIYGRNTLKIFFRIKGPMTLGLGMLHWGLGPMKVYSQ